jgi:hypothetical protein
MTGAQLFAKGASESVLASQGTDNKVEIPCASQLGIVDQRLGHGRAIQPLVLGVGNYAGHGPPRRGATSQDLLAEGALAGKVGAGGGFIDDRDRAGVVEVVEGKEAA